MTSTLRLWTTPWLGLLGSVLRFVAAESQAGYISGSDVDGVARKLRLDRTPALHTGNYRDCLGRTESFLDITKFDAGIYTDNVTVVFHLDGTTNIQSESVMIHISLFAYGEERFKMIFDPCHANIHSLCPMNANEPITAYGMWYLTPQQTEYIPAIAYQIPDFDGYTRIQIFANSTQSLIGCLQADMENGNSFSHTGTISPILGLFAAVASITSFLTAVYGVSITHMRSHYAHSLSALVVFETYHTIFFSGALSLQWPKVLPAWWSNFAWAAGIIIPSPSILKFVDVFTGLSENVPGANLSVPKDNGAIFREIYSPLLLRRETSIKESNPSDYTWAGEPVHPGVSLPGYWYGLSGTLAALDIADANAFMIALIWLVFLLIVITVFMAAFKYSLEFMGEFGWIEDDRLKYFRTHWISYLTLALLRTLLIYFMIIMPLSMYQFALDGSAGPTAMAAISHILFLVGMGGLVTYACYFRLRFGRYTMRRSRIEMHHTKMWKVVPWATPRFASTANEKGTTPPLIGSFAFPTVQYLDDDPTRATVHRDQAYIKRFGWLSARYRRTRWWFFACWLLYHFLRACFVGGGRNTPNTQLYGLLIFEIISFFVMFRLNPFESRRNTALAVWMLGTTKIATTALSIAFLPSIGLNAILATGVGIIVVVIQGLLVISVMILILLGCVSTWMSVGRNKEEFPDPLKKARVKFYDHIEARAPDAPPLKGKKNKGEEGEVRSEQGDFSVKHVRKARKIEDDYSSGSSLSMQSVQSLVEIERPAIMHSRADGGLLIQTSWPATPCIEVREKYSQERFSQNILKSDIQSRSSWPPSRDWRFSLLSLSKLGENAGDWGIIFSGWKPVEET